MLAQSMNKHEHYDKLVRGTSPLRSNQRLIFNMRSGTIVFDLDDELILGRADRELENKFINLSGFGGLGAGVSRQHAYIVRGQNGQVLVGDLNSSNGTYLNEDRLLPEELYPLDSGDVLRLGSMIIHVLFEQLN